MFGLIQEDVSELFGFKYALMYAITEVQANQKSNNADLLVDSKYTFSEGNGRGTFLFASKKVSPVANEEAKFSEQMLVKGWY
jgi:hypothetical protein